MGLGYYEHEIEVKFAEGLLNSSREWQWFIDYTEGSIEPDADMESISDFGKCYHSIQSVFVHLARLVDAVGPLKVNITKTGCNGCTSASLLEANTWMPKKQSRAARFTMCLRSCPMQPAL